MEKDQIILLENRGLISITGEDSKIFFQNIITNDVEKVTSSDTIFSGIFTPQGKYLFEFFLIHYENGYLLDCDNKFTNEIIKLFSKYKLRSQIQIRDISSEHVIGVISLDKFSEIQKSVNRNTNTIEYREKPLFIDPRNKKLGARMISSLAKLHLNIKKLNLKIKEPNIYFAKAHSLGIPVKGVENLKNQLFGLEANFEELHAIDFNKGCYIGQENTARMKLKNKLRRRLLAIKTDGEVMIGDDLSFKEKKIGKVLMNKPYPFALVKLYDPDFLDFKDKELESRKVKVKIINNF